MNAVELFKINYDADRITLSARDLHEFLEVETPFKKWFGRMAEYGFQKNIDYREVMDKIVHNSQGGRPSTDYEITLDMAKEIAMIQRNEKGKVARQYFIEIEKQWNSPERVIARGYVEAKKQLDTLNQKVIEMQPKVDYFDNLVDRNLLTSLRDTAKELKIGQKLFNNKLLEDGYLYRDQKNKLKPYQKYLDKGLFELKEFTSKYNNHADVQTLVTPKGRETFRLIYCNS